MTAPSPIATSGIVAEAFGILKMGAIASFADDTQQAADAARYYDRALGHCLGHSDWAFASRLVSLPPLSALPDGLAADADLPNSYQLPGDYVVLREVRPEDARWRVDDAGLLRADQVDGLIIRYTRRITNEALLPDAFATAVAYALALRMAPFWGNGDRDEIRAGLRDALADASRADRGMASPERYDDEPVAGDWVNEALR